MAIVRFVSKKGDRLLRNFKNERIITYLERENYVWKKLRRV